MIVGGIYFGVGGHFWYGFLDRRFPGKDRSMIVQKLVREMAFGPPYVSGCFLIVNSLENKTFKESWSNLMHNLKYILTVSLENLFMSDFCLIRFFSSCRPNGCSICHFNG